MTIFGLTLEQWAYFKLYIGLAGPLLLFVYLPIALAGLFFLATRKWRWWMKAPILLVYLVVTYAVPLGDVTVNSMNMAKMCDKVGLHINRTVEVDGYFSRHAGSETLHKYKYIFIEFPYPGMPVTRIEKINGKLVKTLMPGPTAEWEYVTFSFDQRDIASGVSTGSHEVVRNRITNEIIAEEFTYKAWSGWLDQKIAALIDNSVGGCYAQLFMYESINKILIPRGMDK